MASKRDCPRCHKLYGGGEGQPWARGRDPREYPWKCACGANLRRMLALTAWDWLIFSLSLMAVTVSLVRAAQGEFDVSFIGGALVMITWGIWRDGWGFQIEEVPQKSASLQR